MSITPMAGLAKTFAQRTEHGGKVVATVAYEEGRPCIVELEQALKGKPQAIAAVQLS